MVEFACYALRRDNISSILHFVTIRQNLASTSMYCSIFVSRRSIRKEWLTFQVLIKKPNVLCHSEYDWKQGRLSGRRSHADGTMNTNICCNVLL